MSSLTRRYLVTAAVFLLAGIGIGVWMLVARELFGRWPTPYQISAHAHLILVGTVLEMILGTALWLFPRPPRAERPARDWPGELAWWALTAGTAVRAGAELVRAGAPAGLGWVVVGAGLAQVAGLILGLAALRPRIRLSARPERT